jgi:hypothetical protein
MLEKLEAVENMTRRTLCLRHAVHYLSFHRQQDGKVCSDFKGQLAANNSLSVDFFSITYFNNNDHYFFVMNFINYTVIANTDAPGVICNQFFTTMRTRIFGERKEQ